MPLLQVYFCCIFQKKSTRVSSGCYLSVKKGYYLRSSVDALHSHNARATPIPTMGMSRYLRSPLRLPWMFPRIDVSNFWFPVL